MWQPRLEILVENQGRINYGPLFGQGKGILDGVLINQRYVFHWEQRAIDLDRPLARVASAGSNGGRRAGTEFGAGFFHGELTVDEPADTYLALPGFGKGIVWINGFLLGRFWESGPQVTLYVPGPLLKAGITPSTSWNSNTVATRAEFRTEAELGEVGVTYVEDLG